MAVMSDASSTVTGWSVKGMIERVPKIVKLDSERLVMANESEENESSAVFMIVGD